MSLRVTIFIFITVGGLVGGYIPVLWGESGFSTSSIVGNFIGGLVGIWLGYHVYKNYL